MSQGRRQRLRKAQEKALAELVTIHRHKLYDERQAIIDKNLDKSRIKSTVERKRDEWERSNIRTSIAAVVCGINGSGHGSVKPKWDYKPGSRRRIARMTAQSVNTKEFYDNTKR